MGVIGGFFETVWFVELVVGGFIGVASSFFGVYVVMREFSRSVFFGDSDALLFYTGAFLVGRCFE